MGVVDVSAASYRRSTLHQGARDWPESNCYVDLWIALLSALGAEPRASLGATLAVDFEGDQWTFYKPWPGDLNALYGIVVEELTIWRNVLAHCEIQVQRGRIPLVEVDAFHLPDTEQTDYRRQHTKTTIAVNELDATAATLGYFHNAGYYELSGEDFEGLFLRAEGEPAHWLPPYCELVKLDALRTDDDRALRERAVALTARHLARAPHRNPFTGFGESLEATLRALIGEPVDVYHHYVFASLRQCGSAYELGAEHLRWLGNGEPGPLSQAADALTEISATAKLLVLKSARIVQRGRMQDLQGHVREMGEAWERAYLALPSGLAM